MPRLLIIYKSGAQVELDCESWEVSKAGAELRSITVVKGSPKPVLYGADEIAAIYETKP
jgi:hypothetical protein